VAKEIPVGYHPYGVAASSDRKVYVANNESEYVSVIDVDPSSGGFDHVIANVKTGSKNRSIVVTPDAGLILVTGDDGVAIIDRDPNSPTFNDVVAVASKGSTTRHVTITPDAALALATTEDGVILIIDIFQPPGTEFGNVIASVTTGSKARNINISPDAMYVYITNPEDNTVSVFQLDYSIVPGYGASLNNPLGLVPITTIAVGEKPYAIAGHPNSEYILVTHDSETGGVSKIGVEEESLDPIYNLNELIASVSNAIDRDVISSRFGNRLLLYLNITKARYEDDRFFSAIFYLDVFIRRVKRGIRRDVIPEDQGDIWLEAAYRIRKQMVKDLFEHWHSLKAAGEDGYQSGAGLNEQLNTDKDVLGDQRLRLENRPNPFSDYTLINFEIPEGGQADMPVIMRVFNINGQVVKTLVHKDMAPGRHIVHWDCMMDGGGMAPDGIYLLELITPDQRKAITISVVK
jgi:DNA-binding beta-propeller fold protein YncE